MKNTKQPLDECREAFEAWALREAGATKLALTKLPSGIYNACSSTQMQWQAWQAAYSARSQSANAAEEENKRLREALNHYANSANWTDETEVGQQIYLGDGHGFVIAQQALQPNQPEANGDKEIV